MSTAYSVLRIESKDRESDSDIIIVSRGDIIYGYCRTHFAAGSVGTAKEENSINFEYSPRIFGFSARSGRITRELLL